MGRSLWFTQQAPCQEVSARPPTSISLLASSSSTGKPPFACSPFSTHHLAEHHRSGMPNSSPPIITLGTLVLRDLEPQATHDLLGIKNTTRVSYSLRFLNLSLFSSLNSHGLQGRANHKYCLVTVHLHEASQLGNTRHTLSFFAILVCGTPVYSCQEFFKYKQWFWSWQRVGMPH